jgi:hypothetical protein
MTDDCFKTCPEFASLIERCWAGTAAERPSFNEVCIELDAMTRDRLPATKATLPVMEIPTITGTSHVCAIANNCFAVAHLTLFCSPESEAAAAAPSAEPARVTHSMPSMKYRQAARPLASVAPLPAKNSLALDKGKEREPPRSIQTIMPNKAGRGAFAAVEYLFSIRLTTHFIANSCRPVATSSCGGPTRTTAAHTAVLVRFDVDVQHRHYLSPVSSCRSRHTIACPRDVI